MAVNNSSLGLGLATASVAGNMIGSGIYLLPASLGSFGSISLLGWIGALAVAIIYAAMLACAAFGASRYC
jgi:amino acid transporter